MSTPNDGSSAPAGFPDMQPTVGQNSSGTSNSSSAHTTNVTVNGSNYTVNITGEESASDLMAERQQVLEDEKRIEEFKH